MSEEIRVLVKRVGDEPKIETIAPGLHPMQEIVGGNIERIIVEACPEREISLWFNEEGRMFELPTQTVKLLEPWNKMEVFGNCFLEANEFGESVDLTPEEISRWMNLWSNSSSSRESGSQAN